ncbi:hypothetical protein HanRHA438_Chr15g0684541 [Helianthus annuus]|nr:hypothetical protein HanRHA438_Chr15g0684541 [Helianthus annuus]
MSSVCFATQVNLRRRICALISMFLMYVAICLFILMIKRASEMIIDDSTPLGKYYLLKQRAIWGEFLLAYRILGGLGIVYQMVRDIWVVYKRIVAARGGPTLVPPGSPDPNLLKKNSRFGILNCIWTP